MNLFTKIYKQIILEALWHEDDPPYDVDAEPFTYHLYTMYALEYKLHALKQNTIAFNPRRMENITSKVTEYLLESTLFVRGILLKTIREWLRFHAITNPSQWAEARLEQSREYGDEQERFDTALGEYIRYIPMLNKVGYSHGSNVSNLAFSKLLKDIEQDIDNFPVFKAFFENTVIPDYKTNMHDEYNDNPTKFKEIYNLKEEDDAENFINNLTLDDIGSSLRDAFDSSENLINNLKYYGDFEDVMQEIYEKIVFPLWYGKWQAEGIDETRDTIEEIYTNLNNANEHNLGNLIATTNAGLNAVHQSGPMLDYVAEHTDESNLKGTLQSLTDGTYIDKWNEQLKEIGINLQ